MVEYLADCGSAIDPIDDTNSTPLILASSGGKIDVVNFLLRKGVDVNHKTQKGQSALQYACSKGHKEVNNLV